VAGAVVAAVLRRRWTPDVSGQVALVTGGSRGLGLLLAGELAARGCRLVICARNTGELETARLALAARGAEVLAVPCDIADRQQAEQLVDRATARFGRLDILVNNAGIVQVGPVQDLPVEDFRTAVDVMLLAPIHLTMRALPQLLASPSGRVINITSIGGKVPTPHLLPYVAAKFGAVGFSEALHAELAPHGVRVTTVVPGLMRTGSHRRALFAGHAEKEYGWFATAASAPLLSMDARRAARRIVSAALAGRAEVSPSPVAAVASRVAGAAPGTTTRLLSVAARMLPRGTGERVAAEAGQVVEARSPSRVRDRLTTLGRRASQRLQPAASGR
jgi:NAD(P)-dependent dehydrogenase (short-subunit alcohol dehydrogenase family)